MAKKITGYVKLQVPAGSASPSPPIGPALGQAGLNIMDFCKKFNTQTKNIKDTVPIPTSLIVYSSKHFDILLKSPTTSYLLASGRAKQFADQCPSGVPTRDGRASQGGPSIYEIYHIALFKQTNRGPMSVRSICKSLISSAKSMGLSVQRSAP